MSNDTSSIAKWMFALAWVAIIALLYMYFSGMLERKYNPNQSPVSSLSGSQAEVQLLRNQMGHYVTSGFINGQQVTFLLDTGATNVSVPQRLARDLNLQAGQRFQAQTANGVITVARTVIPELTVGDIRMVDVEGSINPGMTGNEILLGMSFLKHLELTQRGDLLILRTEPSD